MAPLKPTTQDLDAVDARWVGYLATLPDGTQLIPGETVLSVGADEARDSDNWEPLEPVPPRPAPADPAAGALGGKPPTIQETLDQVAGDPAAAAAAAAAERERGGDARSTLLEKLDAIANGGA